MAKGFTKAAIKEFEEAIRLDPDLIIAYNNLGIVYYSLEQYDDAIKAFEHAVKIDPINLEAQNNLKNAKSKKAVQ
jgi:tetratricopeptide (TPR) repeat protein